MSEETRHVAGKEQIWSFWVHMTLTHGDGLCVYTSVSHVWFFTTPWTVAHQASVSIEFSRQETSLCRDWTHVSCASCIGGEFFTTSATWEADGLRPTQSPDLLIWPLTMTTSLLTPDSQPQTFFLWPLSFWPLTLTSNIWLLALDLCCCLVAQSCPSLCNPMDCSTPGFPILYHLLELAQTHVHRVGDAIQPSHSQSSTSPTAFNISQH